MDWSKYKNILCIRPDGLGDLLMSTPAIRALKESVAGRKITILTSFAASPIASYIPEVDDIITFDVPWVKTEDKQIKSKAIYALIDQLKERKFDAAVIFTVFSQNPQPTALLCYLAEIPHILAYSRENPWNLISNWVVDNEPFTPLKHQVERDLHLVTTIGATTSDRHLSVRVPEEAITETKKLLKEYGINLGKKWVIIHPGVSETKRQYPPQLFAETGRLLVQNDYQVLLTGSASELKLVQKIQKNIGPHSFSLAGMLDIEKLVALISLAPVLIANNTGPVHIAAALQRPVVVLYALTNPQHTPWMTKNRVLYFSVPEQQKNKDATLVAIEKYMKDLQRPYPSPHEVVKATMDLES